MKFFVIYLSSIPGNCTDFMHVHTFSWVYRYFPWIYSFCNWFWSAESWKGGWRIGNDVWHDVEGTEVVIAFIDNAVGQRISLCCCSECMYNEKWIKNSGQYSRISIDIDVWWIRCNKSVRALTLYSTVAKSVALIPTFNFSLLNRPRAWLLTSQSITNNTFPPYFLAQKLVSGLRFASWSTKNCRYSDDKRDLQPRKHPLTNLSNVHSRNLNLACPDIFGVQELERLLRRGHQAPPNNG